MFLPDCLVPVFEMMLKLSETKNISFIIYTLNYFIKYSCYFYKINLNF